MYAGRRAGRQAASQAGGRARGQSISQAGRLAQGRPSRTHKKSDSMQKKKARKGATSSGLNPHTTTVTMLWAHVAVGGWCVEVEGAR